MIEPVFSYAKDPAIAHIVKQITDLFGLDFFEWYTENGQQYLVDFWEADLNAVGLKKNEKIAYISMGEVQYGRKTYCVELEIIDTETLEKTKTVKEVKQLNEESLLQELNAFFA